MLAKQGMRVSDELGAAFDLHRLERIEAAATMYAVQKMASDSVGELTKKAYGRLLDAHLLIVGVLATGMLRTNGKIVSATHTSVERSALFAAYFIGMDLCERAIEEGRYLQAHVLLRQEMETLAQLKAVRHGSRNESRSPNIAVLEESIRRIYSELSSAAHLSAHHIVRQATSYEMTNIKDLPGPTSGSRFFPDFNEHIARTSFTLHLILTAEVIEEYANQVNSQHQEEDHFTVRDMETTSLAMRLMRSEGMIEMDEGPEVV
jgi:hypothetical protein